MMHAKEDSSPSASPHDFNQPALDGPGTYPNQFDDRNMSCQDILNQAIAESSSVSTYDDSTEMTSFYSQPYNAGYDNSVQYSYTGTESFYHQVPVATTSGSTSKSSKNSSKPKRKRVITRVQRKAANVRERRRMVTLNDAFEQLKLQIPRGAKEKKLSRIDTLRTAISYITSMQKMLVVADSQEMNTQYQYPQPQYSPDASYLRC
jgi:hypothetical protein